MVRRNVIIGLGVLGLAGAFLLTRRPKIVRGGGSGGGGVAFIPSGTSDTGEPIFTLTKEQEGNGIISTLQDFFNNENNAANQELIDFFNDQNQPEKGTFGEFKLLEQDFLEQDEAQGTPLVPLGEPSDFGVRENVILRGLQEQNRFIDNLLGRSAEPEGVGAETSPTSTGSESNMSQNRRLEEAIERREIELRADIDKRERSIQQQLREFERERRIESFDSGDFVFIPPSENPAQDFINRILG